MKIIYINNYNHKNTAALRKAWKDGLLELKYDRNSSQYGVKIYRAYSKATGNLKAEFHLIWTKKRIYHLDAQFWAYWESLNMGQQKNYLAQQIRN